MNRSLVILDDTNETEQRNFRREIEMMKSLGNHPNIVSLVGYRTIGRYPFLVVEYCPQGDLLSFLRKVSIFSICQLQIIHFN